MQQQNNDYRKLQRIVNVNKYGLFKGWFCKEDIDTDDILNSIISYKEPVLSILPSCSVIHWKKWIDCSVRANIFIEKKPLKHQPETLKELLKLLNNEQ